VGLPVQLSLVELDLLKLCMHLCTENRHLSLLQVSSSWSLVPAPSGWPCTTWPCHQRPLVRGAGRLRWRGVCCSKRGDPDPDDYWEATEYDPDDYWLEEGPGSGSLFLRRSWRRKFVTRPVRRALSRWGLLSEAEGPPPPPW
jgi:hypothetical protein